MKENWLEDSLYDRLGGKEEEVDLDVLWNELETRRKPRKKRNRFLLWLMFPFILLGFITLYYVFGNVKEDVAIVQDVVEQQESGEFKEDEKSLEVYEESLNDKFSKIPLEDEPVFSASTSTIGTTSVQVSTSAAADTHLKPTTSIDNYTQTEEIFDDVVKPNKAASEILLVTAKNNNETGDQQGHQVVFAQSLLEENSIEPQPVLAAINGLSLLDLAALSTLREIPDCSFRPPLKRNVLKNELLFLGSYGDMKIEEVARENPLDMIEVGLGYRRYFNESFFIQTGLNVQQYTSSLESTHIDKWTKTESDTVLVVLQNGFIAEVQTDTFSREFTSTYADLRYQKFRSVRIPILVGFKRSLTSRFSVDIAAGLSLNVHSLHQGKYRFDEADLVVEGNRFKPRGDIDFISSLGIGIRLSNNWTINLSGKINMDLMNRLDLTTQDASVRRFRSVNFAMSVGRLF